LRLLEKVKKNLELLRLNTETKGSLSSQPRVVTISRSFEVGRPHPDVLTYIPGMPKETEVADATMGITGKSIGQPQWDYIGTISFDYQPKEKIGYIELIFVWDEFRGKGYGRLLVDTALEEMKAHGIQTVYTAPVKPGSPAFFSALGFAPLGNTPLYYKQFTTFSSSRVQIPPGPLDLKTQFGNEFRNMIFEGEREGREVGAMICQSPSGELHLSRVCWGVKGKVHVTDCHDHLKPYGSYHVHVRGSDVFSPQDLEQAIEREQLSCIGYMKAGVPMLKYILPRKYYEYTSETKSRIHAMLNEAAKDISLLSSNPELSEDVHKKLRDVEQLLDVHEIQL